jgi:hypothetical protein
MNSKTLMLLAGATVGTLVLAWLSLSHRDADVQAEPSLDTVVGKDEKNRLFPGLLAKINDVTSVTIERKEGTVVLRKAGDAWGLADKGDFPVAVEPVRKMLIVLGEMTKVEEKTSDPALYSKLDLADPSSEGSKSARITLADKDGKAIAKLVVGKERESKGAVLSNQRYVRKDGEAASWLVQGTFDLKEKGSDWLEKSILELKRDRIRSVEITQPEGELLAVDRPSVDVTDFTLVDMPEGKELTYPTATNAIAGGLEYVTLEDVEPAGRIDFSVTAGPTARYKTFDGLVVTVKTKDQDGKNYARFEASYEAPAAVATPPAAGAEAADPAKKADTTDPTKKPAPALKSAEEVQKEVAEMNARLSKWTYVISTYSRANFGKKKIELLKDKAPPPPPPGTTAPGEGGEPKNKEAFVIPNNIPPEIQAQIKADQEKRGNKVVIQAPVDPNGATPTPAEPPPGGTKPADTKPAEPPH